jgi:hypothetical protein
VTRAKPTTLHWVLGLLVFLALAAWPVAKFLLLFPQDQWQVDIQVYREGGLSVLQGRPIYQQMTDPPQLLPFTYPPIAAILAIPLALVPFEVAAWGWTVAQLATNIAIAWVAWYHLRHRVGAWAPVLVGAVAGAFLWTQPVGDGIRFAQVNAFLVLMILLDLKRPRLPVLRSIPPGVLVGLAMAIKLTPGVFVIHYLVCRRWREAFTAIATASAVSSGRGCSSRRRPSPSGAGHCPTRPGSGPTTAPPTRPSARSSCAAARGRVDRALPRLGALPARRRRSRLLARSPRVPAGRLAHGGRGHRAGRLPAQPGLVGAPPALAHGDRPGDPRRCGRA